jgi:hypothetical protein
VDQLCVGPNNMSRLIPSLTRLDSVAARCQICTADTGAGGGFEFPTPDLSAGRKLKSPVRCSELDKIPDLLCIGCVADFPADTMASRSTSIVLIMFSTSPRRCNSRTIAAPAAPR